MLSNKISGYGVKILTSSFVSWNRKKLWSIAKKHEKCRTRSLLGSVLFVFIFSSFPAWCQLNQVPQTDTLNKKQIRAQKRIDFKKIEDRNYLRIGFVHAHLDTELSFELPDRYLIAKIGLEDDFGLPGKKTFITASYINRLTPSSGIYANYYGIDRSENRHTDRDIIFKDDTIPAGVKSTGYFNTNVVSIGYLYSIKQDPDAYLGAFINIYFMWLDTGILSEIGDIDTKVRLVAPLPNVGLIAMFKLTSWLYLNGDVSFFSLYTKDFSGSLYSFSAKLLFKPTRWLAFDLSYQEFDIRVIFPYEEINTTVDYNFRGPALGMSFFF